MGGDGVGIGKARRYYLELVKKEKGDNILIDRS